MDNKKSENNRTDICWRKFTKRKHELTDVIENFFNILEKKGKLVKLIRIKIRFDDVEENLILKEEIVKILTK